MPTTNQPERIACPHCQAMIKSAGLAAGSQVNCPKCGQGFRLGEGSGVGSQGPGVRGQELGGKVEGRKSKVEGRDSAARPPPPPSVRSGEPRPVVATRDDGGVRSTQYSVPGTNAPERAANPVPQAPNPKPHPRDNLIDPNLLAPPPPRVKPKATEVAVVCQVCGTRVYAPLDKIGQEVKCPDCHTRNLVPPLKQAEGKSKPAGPSLEGTEDYVMSEVVERPKYRPLQATRGEYEVLSAMDPAAVEHRLTVPGEQPRKARVTVAPEGEEDEEVALEPPVERVQEAIDPRTILPQPELEPENAMYDGRYDDGLIGDAVDSRSPDAWKRAPLVYGVLGFLVQPGTLLRWAAFAAGLAMLSMLAEMTWRYAQAEDHTQILALLLMMITIPAGTVWLLACGASALAVVQETANGEQEVSNWPDWNPFEWFGPALYILVAAIVSGLPGGIVSGLTLAATREDPAMAAFGLAAPLLLSWMLLFPFVLYSMLAENSFMAVFSPQVARSFGIAGDGWLFFYMYSILIFLFGGMALGLLTVDGVLARAVAAIGVIGLMFLYLRLLGRLMWFANERLAKLEHQAG